MNTLSTYAQARVPSEIWALAAMLLLLALCTALWLRQQGREWFRPASMIVLCTYVFILICSTVLFRPYSSYYALKWPPLWSYMRSYGGLTGTVLIANGLNVLLFVPIGFLYQYACKHARWWTMLVVAFALSFSIEVAQYLIPCGFAEVDDMLHNCLGALIGYGIAAMISRTIVINKKKRQSAMGEELPADNNK